MASMNKQAGTYGGPIEDGTIVTMTPEQALLSGHYWKVPFIIGTNSADIGFSHWHTLPEIWTAFGPDSAEAQGAFDPSGKTNAMMVGWKVAAEMMMTEPARFVASTLSNDGVPSYEYRFSYVAKSISEKAPGAFHASEIPFVFDTVHDKYGAALTPEDQAIAEKMNMYWVNFAKTGDPNGPELPHWPAYTASKDELIDFTSNGPIAQPDPWKRQLDLVEGLEHRMAETPLTTSAAKQM